MERNLSITNDLAVSKITSFSKPLLTIGVMYMLSLTLLTYSIPSFLWSIILLSLVSMAVIIHLVKSNKAELENILEVDTQVRNYWHILKCIEVNDVLSSHLIKAKEEEIDYICLENLDRISERCKITREEAFEQMKKINNVHLADVFKTLDIVKGNKMSYDKEKNVLYMTLADFEKLELSLIILQKMIIEIANGLIEKENLNEQFLEEATFVISFDMYVKSTKDSKLK